MPKNKIAFIVIACIILIMIWAGIYFFYKSNLQAAILENQVVSEERIAELEKKIEAMQGTDDDILGLSASPKAPVENDGVAKNIPAPSQLMNEEDLLKNYFAETPTLIMPEDGTELKSKVGSDLTGPILSATPAIFDLGTISKKNGIVEANFELKNTGKSDLVINYALTSCGCTTAPLKEEKILKSGESLSLPVTYDPNFYGPEYELGPIEKTVTIFSNYSIQPFYKIKLKAVVTP